MRWKIAVLVVVAIALSAASCEACFPGHPTPEYIRVNNETDEPVVVEYLAVPIEVNGSQEVLRLEAGEWGSFAPIQTVNGSCLRAPVLVRSEIVGRVLARAEAGECFEDRFVITARG